MEQTQPVNTHQTFFNPSIISLEEFSGEKLLNFNWVSINAMKDSKTFKVEFDSKLQKCTKIQRIL